MPPDRVLQRRGADPYLGTTSGWYGHDPVFQITLERTMNAVPEPVRRVVRANELAYLVGDLDVPGDLEAHNITIRFLPTPPAWAAGIPPCDYPSVFTDVDRPRLHQNRDGSLCLWAPHDPPDRRWWHGDGLRALVEITRRHLLCELEWWRTGGTKGGVWPIEDAPHGGPDVWSPW